MLSFPLIYSLLKVYNVSLGILVHCYLVIRINDQLISRIELNSIRVI